MKGQKSGTTFPVISPENPSALLGHELTNVLNGLLGMAESLSETGLNAEQLRWLDAIVHSGLQIRALIRPGRFSMFRQRGGTAVAHGDVDGVLLVEQIVISHLPVARIRRNHLLLTFAPDVSRYWECDPCLVRQLLDNLLGNAIKFTHQGEVHLEVLAGEVDRTVRFRIIDTGPGMERTRHDPPRIAEPCESASRSECWSGQGLGLGICQRIVEILDGRLKIISSGKAGTCIEAILPGVLQETRDTNGMSSMFFRTIRCRLRLRPVLVRSVGCLLERLGAQWTTEALEASGEYLDVEVRESGGQPGSNNTKLVLCATNSRQPAGSRKRIALPVLESSLGPPLLEMVFEWREQQVRNGTPGSGSSTR